MTQLAEQGLVAHLLPSPLWAAMRRSSSSLVQASRLMLGRSWLCHRSLHCLPMRPANCQAIWLQLPSPQVPTSLREQHQEGCETCCQTQLCDTFGGLE